MSGDSGSGDGLKHRPSAVAVMGDVPGWRGEQRWRCPACGFTVKYHVESARPCACPACPLDDGPTVALPPGAVDSVWGRYKPGAVMHQEGRPGTPWRCDVCNAVRSVMRDGDLCPVCDERWRKDLGG